MRPRRLNWFLIILVFYALLIVGNCPKAIASKVDEVASDECSLNVRPVKREISHIDELRIKYELAVSGHIWFVKPLLPSGITVVRVEGPDVMHGSEKVLLEKADHEYFCTRDDDDLIPFNAWSSVWKPTYEGNKYGKRVDKGWYQLILTYSLSGEKTGAVCRCFSEPFRLVKDSIVYLVE